MQPYLLIEVLNNTLYVFYVCRHFSKEGKKEAGYTVSRTGNQPLAVNATT